TIGTRCSELAPSNPNRGWLPPRNGAVIRSDAPAMDMRSSRIRGASWFLSARTASAWRPPRSIARCSSGCGGFFRASNTEGSVRRREEMMEGFDGGNMKWATENGNWNLNRLLASQERAFAVLADAVRIAIH